MSQTEDINRAMAVPEKITASDGRTFYVQSWAPVVDCEKGGVGLVKITAQLVVKVDGQWVVAEKSE